MCLSGRRESGEKGEGFDDVDVERRRKKGRRGEERERRGDDEPGWHKLASLLLLLYFLSFFVSFLRQRWSQNVREKGFKVEGEETKRPSANESKRELLSFDFFPSDDAILKGDQPRKSQNVINFMLEKELEMRRMKAGKIGLDDEREKTRRASEKKGKKEG